MTDPIHPTDDVLVKLAEGRLLGPELEQLEKHLDHCGACRTLLAVVSNGSAPSAAIERATLSPGEKLGRYEIERLIGAGGMGMLYVARDPQLGRRVALKLMRPAFNDELGRARLLREAQAMAQLSHPNVVHVYELGELSGRVFIAMELLEGGTLREWMKSPRTWREVLAMFVAAGEGLYAAHQSGVVHRDFKPENVMLGKDFRPRVGDFGLARPELVAEEEPPLSPPMRITQVGAILGTPAYMSPEQLLGKPADALSDQYGFCVALYEALAGKRPFPTDSVAELRQMVLGGMPPPPKDGPVPAHVWAAIARGLHPDPAKRFSNLGELLMVLRLGPEPLMLPKRRSRLIIARNLAIAMVATALVALITSRVALSPAAQKPAVAQVNHGIEPAYGMVVGDQRVLAVPRLVRIAVGDSAIADVRTIGNAQLLLKAVGPGRTTLLMWFDDGQHASSLINVVPATAGDPEPAPRPAPPAPAPAPAPAEVTEPEPDPAELKAAAKIHLPATLIVDRGEQKILHKPFIQRVAIGDSSIADVQSVGGDELMVIGQNYGRTTLLVWTKTGRESTEIVVRPGPVKGINGEMLLAVGAQKVLTVPHLQRVAVGDTAIADVKTIGNDELLLIGVGPGTTTVIVWKEDEKRVSYLVRVTDAAPVPGTTQVTLKPGEKYALPKPPYGKAKSDRPWLVKVVSDGDGKAHLVAVASGKTTIDLESREGAKSALLITVSGDPVAPALAEARRDIAAGRAKNAVDALDACLEADAKQPDCNLLRGNVGIALEEDGDSIVENYRAFLANAPADHPDRTRVEQEVRARTGQPEKTP